MKIKNREKHKRIYIALAVFLFSLGFILHASRLIKGFDYYVGGREVSLTISFLIAVIAALMVFMGSYYLLTDKK